MLECKIMFFVYSLLSKKDQLFTKRISHRFIPCFEARQVSLYSVQRQAHLKLVCLKPIVFHLGTTKLYWVCSLARLILKLNLVNYDWYLSLNH